MQQKNGHVSMPVGHKTLQAVLITCLSLFAQRRLLTVKKGGRHAVILQGVYHFLELKVPLLIFMS